MEQNNLEPSSATNTKVRELVITRLIDAPRERVFQAWTDPEQMKRWWGPKAFTAPVVQIDLRVGGKFLGCMRSPEGKDYWSTGVYKEIIVPERLVVSDSFADEHGNVVSAAHYGMQEDWPLEMTIELNIEEQDGKTELMLKHYGDHEIAEKDFKEMQQGWNESLDKLESSLKSPAK